MADVITPGPPLLIQLQTCILPKDRSLADTQSCKSVPKFFAQTQMWRVYGRSISIPKNAAIVVRDHRIEISRGFAKLHRPAACSPHIASGQLRIAH